MVEHVYVRDDRRPGYHSYSDGSCSGQRIERSPFLPQLLAGELQVMLQGGGHLLMSHKPFQRIGVGSMFYQTGAVGVAAHVGMNFSGDSTSSRPVFDGPVWIVSV